MKKLLTPERITAIISTSLAVAILAAMGTADSTRSTTSDLAASRESDLRYQLELAWRRNPPLLEKRLDEVDAVMAAWQASPQVAADRELLLSWLHESIKRSLPGNDGELPVRPQFSKHQAVHAKLDTTVKNQSAAKPTRPRSANQQSSPKAVASTPANPATNARRTAAPTKPASPLATPKLTITPVPKHPPAQPHVVAQPPVNAAPPKNQSSYAEQPEQLPRATLTITPVEPPELVPQKPAAPRPAAEQPAQHSVSVRPKPAPASTPAQAVAAIAADNATIASPTNSAEPLEFNLIELNARIGGYHDGLDGVNAELVSDKRMNTLRLTRLVSELEELAAQHEFIQLYYSALSDRERQFVFEPRPIRPYIDLAEEARIALEEHSADFLTTASGDRQPSKLAQRLKKLVEGNP